MKVRHRLYLLVTGLLTVLSLAGCSKIVEVEHGRFKYEMVKGDPLNARIYTLANGLKVYMTVYRDEPRIQTYVAVRAGSKHDPADATGLAHYLEHLLFKGTDEFGTLDFDSEKPVLDNISALFEKYRHSSDSLSRRSIYAQIDSLSQIASKFALANEYDKMMSALGATGTNAYTSVEQTVYVNNIPSNQLQKWLQIEGERFSEPVIRLFHTELEVVYEEKNQNLDNDRVMAQDRLYSGLFKKHPYGTQTTIGSVSHLKNPSIEKVQQFLDTYYVANNMALCLSGDFDPDEAIQWIDEAFGSLRSGVVPPFETPAEAPIKAPAEIEVVGPSADRLTLAFRLEGAGSEDEDLVTMVDLVLMNSAAGLIDLNLNQSQEVLDSYSSVSIMDDYTVHTLGAIPRAGQTLDGLKKLLLEQIDAMKAGEFPDWLPGAIVNEIKLETIKGQESNRMRAHAFVTAFTLGKSWEDYVSKIERLESISKSEIVDFVNEKYGDNYVAVFKRTGTAAPAEKIRKPRITPIKINRDQQSVFSEGILSQEVPPIQAVFVDFSKEIRELQTAKNIPVFYLENQENDLFQLFYLFDYGSGAVKKLGMALEYVAYLGTSEKSASEIKQEFYKIGCSFSVYNSADHAYLALTGLGENFEKGLALFEQFLSDLKPNEKSLDNLKSDVFKVRKNAKLDKRAILWEAMYSYGVYGPSSPMTDVLSEQEIDATTADELVKVIQQMFTFDHRILFYGPHKPDVLVSQLNTHHKIPADPKSVPKGTEFAQRPTVTDEIFFVDYEMKQMEVIVLSKGVDFDPGLIPVRSVFNEYIGELAFQELRESRALAYSADISYSSPNKKDDAFYMFGYVGTQADKLPEALDGLIGLINKTPDSESLLASTRKTLLERIASGRITKTGVLFGYEQAKKLGLRHDMRKDIYPFAETVTLSQLQTFHRDHVKGKHLSIMVLGNKKLFDPKAVRRFGNVRTLELEELFGY